MLENVEVVLVCAWPEILRMLRLMFALENRFNYFFLKYDVFPEEYESVRRSKMSKKDYSKTLLYLINLFCKEDGFEAVIALYSEMGEGKVPIELVDLNPVYTL